MSTIIISNILNTLKEKGLIFDEERIVEIIKDKLNNDYTENEILQDFYNQEVSSISINNILFKKNK